MVMVPLALGLVAVVAHVAHAQTVGDQMVTTGEGNLSGLTCYYVGQDLTVTQMVDAAASLNMTTESCGLGITALEFGGDDCADTDPAPCGAIVIAAQPTYVCEPGPYNSVCGDTFTDDLLFVATFGGPTLGETAAWVDTDSVAGSAALNVGDEIVTTGASFTAGQTCTYLGDSLTMSALVTTAVSLGLATGSCSSGLSGYAYNPDECAVANDVTPQCDDIVIGPIYICERGPYDSICAGSFTDDLVFVKIDDGTFADSIFFVDTDGNLGSAPGVTIPSQVVGDEVVTTGDSKTAGLTCTYLGDSPTMSTLVNTAVLLGLATGSCSSGLTAMTSDPDTCAAAVGDPSCDDQVSGPIYICERGPYDITCADTFTDNLLFAKIDDGTTIADTVFFVDTDGTPGSNGEATLGDVLVPTGSSIPAGLTCRYVGEGIDISQMVDNAAALGLTTGTCGQALTAYASNPGQCAEEIGSSPPCSTVLAETLMYVCDKGPYDATCSGTFTDDLLFVGIESGQTTVAEVYWIDTDGVAGSAADIVIGGAGDPLLTDIHGHTFLGGEQPETTYTLFETPTEVLEMTTSSIKGLEGGFFVDSLGYSRAGCGKAVVRGSEHKAIVDAPSCMSVAHGDEGLVVIPMEKGASLVVEPHVTRHVAHGSMADFVNFKVVGLSAGVDCSGLLCDGPKTE